MAPGSRKLYSSELLPRLSHRMVQYVTPEVTNMCAETEAAHLTTTLDGRWTWKPFGISRIQPFCVSVPRPPEVYIDFILKHINTSSTYTISR